MGRSLNREYCQYGIVCSGKDTAVTKADLNAMGPPFYSLHQLFAELAAADLQNRLHILLKRLLKTDLLVIDDFAFKTIDQQAAERFYAMVDGRFRAKSIILTSNRPMTDWPKLFPDAMIANAILDRLAHTSHQIAKRYPRPLTTA